MRILLFLIAIIALGAQFFYFFDKRSDEIVANTKLTSTQQLSRLGSLAQHSVSSLAFGANKLTTNTVELSDASIAFDAPKILRMNELTSINLLLDSQKSLKALEAELGGEDVGVAKILATSKMHASLKGMAFDINPVSPETQLLTKENTTKWTWEVKPKEAGKQTLYLSLSAISKESSMVIKRFDKVLTITTISFNEQAKEVFISNWQWFVSTFLAPFILSFLMRAKG